MLNFCTLFDSNYFSRGVVMHQSLLEKCSDFHLYIFAFDDIALSLLRELKLKNATIISLTEFEDAQLLAVKSGRSTAEYCWTSTPSTVLYCINEFNLDHCTYIDADLFFFNDPKVLVDEMGDKDVLITEHRYTYETEETKLAGKYCVQFITFKNTEKGMAVLNWWRNACLDWCYARYEDGKFGDQKYLDDWTERFEGVHVLQNIGGGVAPWNIQQYDVYKKKDILYIKEKRTQTEEKVIFYHFHYLKFYEGNVVDAGVYKYSKADIELIYKPYIQAIDNLYNELARRDILIPYKIKKGSFHRLRMLLLAYRRKQKEYRIYRMKDFINK